MTNEETPSGHASQATAVQLAGRSFLYGFAGVAGKAAALISVPYLARELGPLEYGLADLATSTAALLGLLVSFSGDIPAARRAGRAADAAGRDGALRMYVLTTTFVSLIVAAALLPLAGVITGQLWSSPGNEGLALVALALVPVSATQAALANLARLTGKGRQHAALSLIDLLAQLGLAVLFVALGMGAAGVVTGFLAGSLLGLAAAALPARRIILGRISPRLGAEMVAEGSRYLPALVLPVAGDLVTRVVLANQLSTQEVGLFGLAIRLASVMSLVAGAFTAAYGPDLLGRAYSIAVAASFRRVFRAYTATLVTAAALLAFLSPEVVRIVAGESFRDAGVVLPWLAAAGAAAGAYALLMLAAGVGERADSVAWTAAVGAATQVGLVIALIGAMGVVASGVSVLVGQVLATTLLYRAIAVRLPGVGSAMVTVYAGAAACGLAALLNAIEAPLVIRATMALAAGAIGAWSVYDVARGRPVGQVRGGE